MKRIFAYMSYFFWLVFCRFVLDFTMFESVQVGLLFAVLVAVTHDD